MAHDTDLDDTSQSDQYSGGGGHRQQRTNSRQRQTVSSSNSTANSPVQQIINLRAISTTKALTDYYIAAMLDNTLDDDRRASLYGAINQHAQGTETLTLSGGAKVPASSVRQMLYLLMTMPEYQLN